MDFESPVTLRGEGEEHRLDAVLAALKERGCSILVAGQVSATAFRPVSRRLFGHPEERRERTLIRLHQTASLAEWFPHSVDLAEEGIRVVDCIDPGRSAAGGFEDWRWESAFDPEEIPALSRRADVEGCLREIDSLVAQAGALAPAQLRVGVFSLNALDGADEMVDVISPIAARVTEHRGMVHFHYLGPADGDTVRTLEEHVDALLVIRKRAPNEPLYQQWRITGYGDTPWIPLRRHE